MTYIWSLPNASRNPYVPKVASGDLREYIAWCYPAYAQRGLQDWKEILEYLEQKK